MKTQLATTKLAIAEKVRLTFEMLLTAMRRSRRSAFKRFRVRLEEVSIKDSEQASKDKLRARGRDAGHPGGATLLSRQVHPVGDWGHVPRGERSV